MLIIEDNSTQAELFFETLKAVNDESEVIFDGQAALNRLAETSPRIMLLDLNLPIISGLKIVERVRLLPHLADTRTIITT